MKAPSSRVLSAPNIHRVVSSDAPYATFELAKLQIVSERATEACEGPETQSILRCPEYDKKRGGAQRDAWWVVTAVNEKDES